MPNDDGASVLFILVPLPPLAAGVPKKKQYSLSFVSINFIKYNKKY
jgi:hypothetical protein